MAVRPPSQRSRGQHFLRSSKLAAELVRAARIQRDDLVLDLGAGTGVLTAALARRAGRVVAIEIDSELAAQLRRRLTDVEVLTADALRVPLPRGPFKVVANLPFEGATAILRRLVDPRVPLQSADVVVEWSVALQAHRGLAEHAARQLRGAPGSSSRSSAGCRALPSHRHGRARLRSARESTSPRRGPSGPSCTGDTVRSVE